MSAVIDLISDALNALWDAVIDFVKAVWDNISMPILGEIFSWFGIVDETVVTVERVSSAVFSPNTEDVVQKRITQAVLSMIKTETSFFGNYIREISYAKKRIGAYYDYADRGNYTHGLPTAELQGSNADLTAINDALNTERNGSFSIISIKNQIYTYREWFEDKLQIDGHNYLPYADSLSAIAPNGIQYNDWSFSNLIETGANTTERIFDLEFTRQAQQALFWITGISNVTEGNSIGITIYSNRPIPTGKTLDIPLVYSGTAVDGVDFVSIPSVTMSSGTDKVSANIQTLNTTNNGSVLTISLGTITNNGVFETVDIWIKNSITINIIDNDTAILSMDDLIVSETAGTAIIPVTLEQAAANPFTVDYTFTDNTAIGGIDYDNTPGTLSFNGTAGEIQNIIIPITSDLIPDDNEQFTVNLSNCSDPTIDISRTAIVTIVDNTQVDPIPSSVPVTIVESNHTAPVLRETATIVKYFDSTGIPEEWFIWVEPQTGSPYNLNSNAFVLSGLEVLPIAILRKDKVSLSESDPAFYSTERLLKKVDLDLTEMIANLESNPDINVIDDAYLIFGACPNDTHPTVSKLFYLTFHKVIVEHNFASNIGSHKFLVKEGDVNIAAAWNEQQYLPDMVGSKTTVGEYIHEILSGTDTDGNYKALHIYYQKTQNTYDEIIVKRLNSMTAVAYNGYHKMAVQTLGDNNFVMPVTWYAIRSLDIKEQLQVYQYILRFEITAIQVTELAWYETSSFISLFEFAMLAITLISLGTAGSITSFITQLAINYAVVEIVIYVAEQTGNAELAAVIGVIASIALNNAAGIEFGSMLDAEQLLNISTQFANNLSTGYGVLGEELSNDIKELNKQAEERLSEIEKSNPKNTVDPLFMAALQSVDTRMFPAIESNFSFNSVFDYDRIIADFYKYKLLIGII